MNLCNCSTCTFPGQQQIGFASPSHFRPTISMLLKTMKRLVATHYKRCPPGTTNTAENPQQMLRLAPRFRLYRDRHRRATTLGTVLLGLATAAVLVYTWTQHGKPTKPPFHLYSEQDLGTTTQHPFYMGCNDVQQYIAAPEYKRANATFVMLTRNQEIDDVAKTMRSIESHFNQWFHYPYVFLNDEPFTPAFMESVRRLATADVQFGTLTELEWEFPEEVTQTLEYKERVEDQGDRGIMYGSMESYHKMCRFYSGVFFKHPLVRAHDWYWRIEPDVEFFCDITYDPFLEMIKNDKQYGFTVMIPELYWSIPNLFRTTKSFIKENNIKLGSLWKLLTNSYHYGNTNDTFLDRTVYNDDNLSERMSEKVIIDKLLEDTVNGKLDLNTARDQTRLEHLLNRAQTVIPAFEDTFDKEEYNLCHFWSNFEIAKRTVFDNPIYEKYFKHLESQGGFWQERWGDAPVHSLGLALTLDFENVHYFKDIGYMHSSLPHCPKNAPQKENVFYVPGYDRYARPSGTKYDPSFEYGSGCRCRCPPKLPDIEDGCYPCMDKWLELAHGVERNSNFANGAYYSPVDMSSVEEEFNVAYDEASWDN